MPKTNSEHFRNLRKLRDEKKIKPAKTVSEDTVVFPVIENFDKLDLRQDERRNALLEISEATEITGDKYVLIDTKILSTLLSKIKCSDCGETSLYFYLPKNKKIGFSAMIELRCDFCERSGLETIKDYSYSSARVSSAKSEFDVNVRMTLIFLDLGVGFAGVEHFATWMGITLYCESSFYIIAKKVYESSMTAVENNLNDVRKKVHKAYRKCEGNENLTENDAINMNVSYEGSWLTRGFASKCGLGCVIDTYTGYVIDFEVLSKYCQVCVIAKHDLDGDSPDFDRWLQSHLPDCSKNHEGSSSSMEMIAAEKIWKRSENYKMKFTNLLCDGDAKTVTHLNTLEIYGPKVEIVKSDCVNHVRKRKYDLYYVNSMSLYL